MDGDELYRGFQKILKSFGVTGLSQLEAARACCDLSIRYGKAFHRDVMKAAHEKPNRKAA